jgi:hypothetical protein
MGKGNTQKMYENPKGRDSFEKMSLAGSVMKEEGKTRERETSVSGK